MRALGLVCGLVTTQSIGAFSRSPAVLSRRPITIIQRMGAATSSEHPQTMVVTLEIEASRIQKFLEVAAIDAKGSRAEPGCYRFDVLQDKDQANKFVFYEVYKDAAAIDFHKSTEHYKAWTEFKAEGGVLSQTVLKADAVDFTS